MRKYRAQDCGYKTPCWVWWGRTNGKYGYVALPDGGNVMAHRVVYEQHKGPLPCGTELDHLCENTLCVNPDHLEPVRHATNVHRGQRTKIKPEQRLAICERYDRGDADQYQLASEYGVDQTTISKIVRRERATA